MSKKKVYEEIIALHAKYAEQYHAKKRAVFLARPEERERMLDMLGLVKHRLDITNALLEERN